MRYNLQLPNFIWCSRHKRKTKGKADPPHSRGARFIQSSLKGLDAIKWLTQLMREAKGKALSLRQ